MRIIFQYSVLPTVYGGRVVMWLTRLTTSQKAQVQTLATVETYQSPVLQVLIQSTWLRMSALGIYLETGRKGGDGKGWQPPIFSQSRKIKSDNPPVLPWVSTHTVTFQCLQTHHSLTSKCTTTNKQRALHSFMLQSEINN